MTPLAIEDSGLRIQSVLLDGGIYTALFWIGQVFVGGLVPLALLRNPDNSAASRILIACGLILAGALAQLYVIIIAGQAWPLDMFPGTAGLEILVLLTPASPGNIWKK